MKTWQDERVEAVQCRWESLGIRGQMAVFAFSSLVSPAGTGIKSRVLPKASIGDERTMGLDRWPGVFMSGRQWPFSVSCRHAKVDDEPSLVFFMAVSSSSTTPTRSLVERRANLWLGGDRFLAIIICIPQFINGNFILSPGHTWFASMSR